MLSFFSSKQLNGDVLCFLWGTKWIYKCHVEESRPPLWSSGQSSWLQNGDILCFLWGTNWIYICHVEESRPPLWSSGQSSWLQNGDILCFLWGTNWIYICYVEESRLPLWSSGQSSWLHSQRSRVQFPELSHFLWCSGSGFTCRLWPQSLVFIRALINSYTPGEFVKWNLYFNSLLLTGTILYLGVTFPPDQKMTKKFMNPRFCWLKWNKKWKH
jgi:hypothetical protein